MQTHYEMFEDTGNSSDVIFTEHVCGTDRIVLASLRSMRILPFISLWISVAHKK